MDALLEGDAGASAQEAAERRNLCLERRVSGERREHYRGWIEDSASWDRWREHHERYVQDQVRRRSPLSAAFTPGEPSLWSGIEGNQWLIRVERIDGLLKRFAAGDHPRAGERLTALKLNQWIATAKAEREAAGTARAKSVNDLASLRELTGEPTSVSPEADVLDELTDLLNQVWRDYRPAFVAFDSEFPGLESDDDWLERLCERCGLAHHFLGIDATLVLMR
ncbi:hypothetical protein [Endothiovibrio diazotrophicus]